LKEWKQRYKYTTIIGAELTDFVLVLNNKEAVKTFSKFGNVTLGGNISGKYIIATIDKGRVLNLI
jgi:lipid-binding SYLF domain-containing protein